jgi:hypothetical protein
MRAGTVMTAISAVLLIAYIELATPATTDSSSPAGMTVAAGDMPKQVRPKKQKPGRASAGESSSTSLAVASYST